MVVNFVFDTFERFLLPLPGFSQGEIAPQRVVGPALDMLGCRSVRFRQVLSLEEEVRRLHQSAKKKSEIPFSILERGTSYQ